MRKSGEPIKQELPGTIRRSPKKAQETLAKAHDSAAEQYGDEERAHRVAYNANPRARENRGKSYGGGAKEELAEAISRKQK